MRLAPLSLLTVIGCSRDDFDTDDSFTGPVAAVPVEPTMSITSPPRGHFAPDGSVDVSGSILASSAPLSTLTLNDTSVAVDGSGAFSTPLSLSPGINVLSLRAEDEDGGRAVDGRAVYAGPLHAPGDQIDGAVLMQLGPELLDDDDPDLDDIAAIAESVLASGGLSTAFIGVPIDASFATITPTALDYADVSIDIIPGDGELEAVIVLYDVWMDFDAEVTIFSTTGSAWIDTMTLALDLVADGGDITASSSVATLAGYGLTVDWFPDSLEDDLAEWTLETLEEEIAGTAEASVAELVGEYLGAFAIDAEVLPGVDLSIALSDVTSSREGLRLVLDATATGPFGGLPDTSGSAATDGAPPAWPTDAAPFWVAADDDLVNQLIFSVWASGALTGFSYTGAELTALSGAELVPPLGPVDSVSLGIEMPPALSQPSHDDMSVDLGLGEWTMVFNRSDGEVLAFSVNALVGAQISFTGDDEIALAMDNRPAYMTLAVGVTEHPEALDPGDLAALIKLMIPPLFGNASGFLPGFALPPLDLGLVTESLAGVSLTPADLSLSLTEDTWLVLDGRLAAD
jgi:hypothetical protein